MFDQDIVPRAEALHDTFGAMFIGAMVAMGVYGITTLQTYFYFLKYPFDSLSFKFLVALVWTFDTAHSILMCHAMYHYLVVGLSHPEILESGTWSLFGSIGFNVVVAFISQCFFILRIHDLASKKSKWILSTFIACIVLGHFAFGIETVIQFSLRQKFSQLYEVTYNCVIPFGVFAVLSDIIIAATLVVLLRRNRSEFEDTNSLIKRLIVYAVNRCVLTSFVAIIEVILFMTSPGSFYSFAFDFVIGKLYANSLLASLNSRKSLQRQDYKGSRTSARTSTVLHVMSSAQESRGRASSARDESSRSVRSIDPHMPSDRLAYRVKGRGGKQTPASDSDIKIHRCNSMPIMNV